MYASIWNWEKVSGTIKKLKGKLGFPNKNELKFLGFKLNLTNGSVYDEYLLRERSDIAPLIYFILHRYSVSEEKKETGRLITFKQVYGGDLYFKTYENNVLKSLEREFGDNIDLLIETSKILGGTKIDVKDHDIAIKIYILPLIPVYLIVDLGDEEFPPLINLFYDSSIKNFFTAEEASHLSELLVIRLIELSRELKK